MIHYTISQLSGCYGLFTDIPEFQKIDGEHITFIEINGHVTYKHWAKNLFW